MAYCYILYSKLLHCILNITTPNRSTCTNNLARSRSLKVSHVNNTWVYNYHIIYYLTNISLTRGFIEVSNPLDSISDLSSRNWCDRMTIEFRSTNYNRKLRIRKIYLISRDYTLIPSNPKEP